MLGAMLLIQLATQNGEALRLEWRAPAECPQAEELRARLGRLKGSAAATVTESAPGWKLVLQVNDAVRELATHTCEEAADAAVLIIQVALAPGSPAAPAWTLRASLVGGAGLGWVPLAVARLGASASLSRGSLALTLDLTSALPVRFAGGPTGGAAVTLHQGVDAQLGACWLFEAGVARAGPCLHGSVGWLWARGENVPSPRTTSLAIFAGGPGVRATVQVLPWLELLGAAVCRFGTRPSVFFEESPPVVEANVASLELLGGIGARF